jgi:hypothetical protein
MAQFSTTELNVRSDRLAFSRIPPEVPQGIRDERIVIAPSVDGHSLYIGPSSMISTTSLNSLVQLFPSEAPFVFNTISKNFGINNPYPQYSLDISTISGIRLQGGSYIGSGYGLFSIPTTALIGGLPSSVFSTMTIPTSALTSTIPTALFAPQTIPGTSIQSTTSVIATSFVGDGALLSNIPIGSITITPQQLLTFFGNNTIPLSTIASTGTLWLRNTESAVIANLIQASSLKSVDISTQQLVTSSLTILGNFNTIGISTGLVRASRVETGTFYGGEITGYGYGISNLNPSQLSGNIPSDKFGIYTVPLNALQQFGNIDILGGNINVGGTVAATSITASNALTAPQITVSSFHIFDGGLQSYVPIYLENGRFYSTVNQQITVNPVELVSTVAGINTNVTDSINTGELNSTLAGLGTLNYISSSQLYSSLQGIGTIYISSFGSTLEGLGTLGYISTSQLLSSIGGLGTAGYISSTQLFSSLAGLATGGYISSTQLFSSLEGLGQLGFLSTGNLNSTVAGLGTAGYLSSFLFINHISAQRVVVSSIGVGCNLPQFQLDVLGTAHASLMSTPSILTSSFTGNLADAQTLILYEI